MSTPAVVAFSRARWRRSGDRSSPDTLAPRRAAVTATTPVPQPTSSTRCAGATCANFTSFAAGMVVKIAAGANDAQCSRSLALSLANGSASAVLIVGSGLNAESLGAVRSIHDIPGGTGERAGKFRVCAGGFSAWALARSGALRPRLNSGLRETRLLCDG